MKKRAVIWSSFMVIMLFGVFTMFVKAQTTTTYYLNNRNELFQGAPANSNCSEIAACIKTTTGRSGNGQWPECKRIKNLCIEILSCRK